MCIEEESYSSIKRGLGHKNLLSVNSCSRCRVCGISVLCTQLKLVPLMLSFSKFWDHDKVMVILKWSGGGEVNQILWYIPPPLASIAPSLTHSLPPSLTHFPPSLPPSPSLSFSFPPSLLPSLPLFLLPSLPLFLLPSLPPSLTICSSK